MYKKLEEILIENYGIDAKSLDTALSIQRETGKRLEKILLEMGCIREEDLYSVLSEHLGIPLLKAEDYPNTPLVLEEIPAKFMKNAKIVPVGLKEGVIEIATADPWDIYTLDSIEVATGRRVIPYLGLEKDILRAMKNILDTSSTSMERIIGDMEQEDTGSDGIEEDVDHLRDMASEAPVIRLVNLLITRAVELRASDIHIESYEKDLRVRYRIDGILHDVESPPKRLQAAIISRIKIMAKLNIAERRLPQDGRIKMKIQNRDIDLRVATTPTLHGEGVVMRILDRGSIMLNLEDLGFPEDMLGRFEELIRRPYGMILVTGPTGSGKTTTLYAALDKINSPDKKIITVEDPIEYQLAGVNQIQVKPSIGLTFANGLRSIVRQDPDVIMVGEIRDAETAEIAVQSALTGHLVFSTLHTNDAAGAVARLLEMGTEDYLLASSLLVLMAQRLVRVICPQCKEPYYTEDEILQEVFGKDGGKKKTLLFQGKGCEKCANTGYFGRTGIYEFLPVDDDIKSLILKRADSNTVKKKAMKKGMRTLREDGWKKVREGITAISEVLRVTQE